MTDITTLPIIQLIPLIHQRELSITTLLEAYIKHIEDINPKINALVQFSWAAAQEAAQHADLQLKKSQFTPGLLFGIPFTAKDLYSVPNYIVSCGTQGLAQTVCSQETTVIQRLIRQGSILLGLTNTPEIGVSLETDNLVYGRTNHPLNNAYSSGGSSGGEAALIAAYGSPLGIGGDHGGGARHPAHCCGIYTLRPSLGRLPQTGTLIPKRGWVALTGRIAPMSRSADDLEIVLQALQGGDGLDPYAERWIPQKKENLTQNIRIANLIDSKFSDFDPAIPHAIEETCKQLTQQNVSITTLSTSIFEEGFTIAKQLFQADAGNGLQKLLDKLGTKEFSPQLQAWLDGQPKESLTVDQYLVLWAKWDEYKIAFLKLFQNYDVILCPVAPQCALPHGATIQPQALWPLIRYTSSISLTECPVVVAPCGYNHLQLPIGVQIIAKPWHDELALATAKKISYALEKSNAKQLLNRD